MLKPTDWYTDECEFEYECEFGLLSAELDIYADDGLEFNSLSWLLLEVSG